MPAPRGQGHLCLIPQNLRTVLWYIVGMKHLFEWVVGVGGWTCLDSHTENEMSLVQLISSGSQRDAALVGGAGNQGPGRGRPSLGASHRKACTTLLNWLLQCWAKITPGIWLLVSCFSEQNRTRRKNNATLMCSLKAWGFTRNRTSWCDQIPSHCNLREPWCPMGFRYLWLLLTVGSGVREIQVQISLFLCAGCVNPGKWHNLQL